MSYTIEIIASILLYITIWFILIVPICRLVLPNSVVKAYLQNKYVNYDEFTWKQKIQVYRLYMLQKEIRENRVLVKNIKNKLIKEENIW